MQITIGGVAVTIIEGSLSIDDAIGERSTAAFVVRDSAGASHYQKGPPVELRDDANALVFAGVIDSAQEQQPGSGTLLLHTIRCTDWHYLADKRIAAKAYESRYAGDVVRDLAETYLVPEGVTIWTELFRINGDSWAEADWNKRAGTGTVAPVSDTAADGSSALEANGYVWYALQQNLTFNPTKLYRIRARVRQVSPAPSGTYYTYVGVEGVAGDGVTLINAAGVNTSASQHYLCLSNTTLTPGDPFAEYVGYFRGNAPTNTQGPHPDPFSPAQLYSGVAFVRPLFILGYTGGGVARLDYLVVEELANIQQGPTIREAVVNYAPVTEALDGLAEKAGFIWWIDAAKALHFVERATYAAPWQAAAADMRQGSVTVEHANPKYRNRQYIKGGRDVTDPQTESRKGDGDTRSFALGFPIAKVPTVQVNAVAQTVGIKGIDTGKQWYWSKGDPVLTQDPTGVPLATTDTLSISYQGEYDIIVLSEDNAQIVGRQQVEGGGTGYVEDVADEPQTSNRDAAFQSANAKLKQYAQIGRRLRFRTRRTGLAPGQLLAVNLPEHALNGTEMLIESVSISDEADVLWYDVLAVEGPEQGSWSRMFKAMATRGQAFVERVNIGQDQTLIILQTFNEAWPWGETVTVTVFACPIPSVNLYPSATLYPC